MPVLRFLAHELIYYFHSPINLKLEMRKSSEAHSTSRNLFHKTLRTQTAASDSQIILLVT